MSEKAITKIKINDVGLIIFDLDGTLLKSNRLNFEAVKRALADIGWKIKLTQARVDELMGESIDGFYRQILPADKFLQKEKLRQIVHGYDAPMITKYGESFPAVVKTLKTLKNRGYKLALYSYAWVDYFGAAIQALGLDGLFDYAECTEENGLTKIELADKIKKQFPGMKAVIVGDSIHDIDTARKVGALAIGAGYGYGGKELEAADIVINIFSELLNIFDRRLPIFEKIAKAIDKMKSSGRAFVVGVNGIDNAGKTNFAQGLAKYLVSRGRKTMVLGLDDFHNSKAIRYSGRNPVDNYYNKCFDLETIVNKFLTPIRQKEKVTVKISPVNYLTDEIMPEKKFKFDQETVIIFEGVFIFRKELAPFIDYKVFIEISFEELKKRARVRDDPEIFKRYETKYIPAQIRYLAEYPPQKTADVVIDNNNWEQPKLKSLLQ